jgi:L-fuculose-phosphate aldolase
VRSLRRQLIAVSRALHQRGWVANHDGNVTARLDGDRRFLATPTATSKIDIDEQSLIEVDGAGKRVAGNRNPFGELTLHLAIYAARVDVGAVVHAHPPYATALGCSGSTLLERPFLGEAVVSLGDRVPTIPFAGGDQTAAAMSAASAEVDAVLCAGNGAFAWGADLEQAYLRLELVEHLAKIATLAEATGGVRALPAGAIAGLLEKRAGAGLGAAADRAGRDTSVIACAPAPHARVAVRGVTDGRAELASAIRDELIKVLRESEQ